MPRRAGLAGVRGGLWLGWMSESNWTDLSLFLGYSIVKPLAQSLILAVIYLVIAKSPTTPYFAAMMVGNAFFMVIGQIMAGATWCVIEDREFYATIRYIYLAGRSMVYYLLGRAAAKILIVSFSSLVVLLFVRFAMGAPVSVNRAWALPGVLALGLGVGATTLMGVGLAGVLLIAARNAGFYSEAVSGSLYLLAGAIFPIEVLPETIRPVARLLPQTYWLEAMRRTLAPEALDWSPSLSALSVEELLGRLFVLSCAWGAASLAAFRAAERRVRAIGTLDAKTES